MHLERARLLLQQSRAADAEREAMLAISQAPDQPLAHAYLALSRSEQGKAEALESAQRAIGLAPDEAFFHYVHGVVLHRLDRDREARTEIDEAIRLDPAAESHFALKASILLAERDWAGALESAERGLALNPEHVGCANYRAMALVRLGRKDEAMQAVDYALQREPENAISHANQGWNRLHRNDPRGAQEHFREALRLNPELEYARQGMREALKARNPVYRAMLAYFLWMSRQSGRTQAVFIIGCYFAFRAAAGAAQSSGHLGVWALVVIPIYLFVYLSWTSGPMFNLLLRLDRFGRFVLSPDERHGTNWFAGCLGLIAAGLVTWWRGWVDGLPLVVAGAILSICVAITFNRHGRTRKWFAAASGALALVAAAGFACDAMGLSLANTFALTFVFGFFALQIAANVVRR